MKNNKSLTYVLVILAVAIGSLGTLCVQSYNQRRMMLKTEYQDWRKLNLILNQIERNYVDTIDRVKLIQSIFLPLKGKSPRPLLPEALTA